MESTLDGDKFSQTARLKYNFMVDWIKASLQGISERGCGATVRIFLGGHSCTKVSGIMSGLAILSCSGLGLVPK